MGVDQRDAVPLPLKMMGGPCAEHAGTDNHDMLAQMRAPAFATARL
jgi:hypothetical protein